MAQHTTGRWFKWVAGIVLTPVLLLLLLAILIYLPPVQQFAADRASQYISDRFGMQVHVGKIHLAFPIDLEATDIHVADSLDNRLLTAGTLKVGVQWRPLLQGDVVVPTLLLADVQFDTHTLIDGIAIAGSAGRLIAATDRIRLDREIANLDRILLSDAHIRIRIDSVATSDSSRSAPPKWQIGVREIALLRCALDLQMTADTLQLGVSMDETRLTDGHADLQTGRYSAQRIETTGTAFYYDLNDQPPTAGLDPLHLRLTGVRIAVDSARYHGRDMYARIRHFAADEQSGVSVNALTGTFVSDEAAITVPELTVATPHSHLEATARIPWRAFEPQSTELYTARIAATIDRRDVAAFAGQLPPSIAPYYPDALLRIAGEVAGNADRIELQTLQGELDGVLKLDAQGTLAQLNDNAARNGTLTLNANTYDEQSLRRLLQKMSNGRLSIPDRLTLSLDASLADGTYRAALQLSDRAGSSARLTGRFHPDRREYEADMQFERLELIRFLPQDSIFCLTAHLRAAGRGYNIFAPSMQAEVSGSLNELSYKKWTVTDLQLDGSLRNNHLQATLDSRSPYIQGKLTADGSVTKNKISGMLILDMDTLDLYKLQLTDRPFVNSFQLFTEAETDLNRNHRIDVTLGNWEMYFGNEQRVRPKTLTLHALAGNDSTYLSFHAGDLGIRARGNADALTLANRLTTVTNNALTQLKQDSTVDLQRLRPLLPQLDLQIEARRDNPLYNYLQTNGIFFDRFELNAFTSPERGIGANGQLHAFVKDTFKIDSVRLKLQQDSGRLYYAVDVVKNRFRRQEPFSAAVNGSIRYGHGDIEVRYTNGYGQTGLHLGAAAEQQSNGWRIRLFPENPVIAFLPFRLNTDNYILYRANDDILADLRLDGERSTSIWIHSQADTATGKMQELYGEVHHLDLGRLTAGLPQLPTLQGIAALSARYVPTDNTFMLVTDASVDSLSYRNGVIGELLMSGVYLPLERGEHQADLHFFHNRNEIGTLSARYRQAAPGSGAIDGQATLNQLPLMMLTPLMQGTARLGGFMNASVAMQGSMQSPQLNGFLQMDSAAIYVTAAGSQLRLDNKRVEIDRSRIAFDNYHIYSAGNTPFVIDGTVDFRNPSDGRADLHLSARNMQLMNAQKQAESMVYGKLFADLSSTLRGPLGGLTLRGHLQVLGGTDASYIMRESPLTVQDRMNGLVDFTYFHDTVPRRNLSGFLRDELKKETALLNSGVDMLLTIGIDPAVRFKVDLDNDARNRIELEGGGDLSFRYTRQGEMLLNGRYTLSGGTIKYNMPIISNKTLRIKEGSYVEWSGNPMDPYLSLLATERVRSSVTIDGSSRSIKFDAGIELKQRMENLGLKFTLDAIDDVTMQNRLAAMGPEEQSKRAVAMLLTGMYISDDAAGNMNFDMGAALNSFLASEINNLTGDLLTGVDFNFGMETHDGNEGQRTDYLFRLSKRFYNDRINVIVGGVVSSGQAARQTNNFINDASLEYRLDRSGNRYAKLFYNRQYESLLEGEIARFGGGFIFRRKMRRFYELFGIGGNRSLIRPTARPAVDTVTTTP